MSNNKQQQRPSFRNLISKEDFEKLDLKEIEQFYIKKEIYLPIKRRKSKQFDSNGFSGYTYFDSHEFNPILIEPVVHFDEISSIRVNFSLFRLKISIENSFFI